MPTSPDPVFVGQLVQVPMIGEVNAGYDSAPALVVGVGVEQENGGVLVTVRVFTASVDLDFGVIDVTCCLYGGEAQALGFDGTVPLGAWPLDYTYV